VFPALRPRVLGGTKRRFEGRRHLLTKAKDFRALTPCIVAWYQFSVEANSEGLRRTYASPRCCTSAPGALAVRK